MYEKLFILHAQLLKTIAHPRRLEIIHLLRDQSLSVNQIVTMLDLPQANISQHLQILRQNQVVNTTKKGKHIFYQLAHPNFIKASDIIRQILIQTHPTQTEAKQLQISMLDLVPVVHDPVCLMRVSPKTAAFSTTYKNKNYFFCASGCLKKFKSHPKQYVKK